MKARGTWLLVIVLAPGTLLAVYTLSSKLDWALADAAAARADLAATAAQHRTDEQQITMLRDKLDRTESQVRESAERLHALSEADQDVASKVRTAGTLIEQLHEALVRVDADRDAGGDAQASGISHGTDQHWHRTSFVEPTPPLLVGELERACTHCKVHSSEGGAIITVDGPSEELFDPGVATIDGTGREELAEIAHAMAANGWHGSLAVDVRTAGTLGAQPPPSALSLASARAARVAESLRASGLSTDSLSTTAEVDAADRRVDAGFQAIPKEQVEICLRSVSPF
jgi:outer membrane protein OmpA-like peptidoglycan-associated protein